MAVTETSQLLNRLRAQPYQSYTYAYPHKTAYRSLSPEHPLDRVWASEDTSALFLYLHVPFCEHRCGFCNLFTHVRPALDMTQPWLRQLRTEAEVVAEALPEHQVARLAIGGGTPTWLDCLQLESLLEVTHKFACQSGRIPAGIEVSPATVTFEKLQLLTEFGVDRVSIGVQSFEDSEAAVMGRPQSIEDVEHALQLIRDTRFAALNIDLIYGGEGKQKNGGFATSRGQ